MRVIYYLFMRWNILCNVYVANGYNFHSTGNETTRKYEHVLHCRWGSPLYQFLSPIFIILNL